MENEDTKLRADFGHHKKKLKELPVQIENEKKKVLFFMFFFVPFGQNFIF